MLSAWFDFEASAYFDIWSFIMRHLGERRFTAKHLTMFGIFLTHSQSVRAKKKENVPRCVQLSSSWLAWPSQTSTTTFLAHHLCDAKLLKRYV